ncbi:MAG: recombination protein RecR [Ruminococcaceae bacterium]|nr:recombination protein RecR [Oscillospiraceae bacterium]
MAEYMESLRILAENFGRLEGVGKKTATRMAFSVLEWDREDVESFAKAILDAKEKIHLCPICQNLTDKDVCPICADPERDHSLICVVTDARAVMAMEKVREFRGVYHVLHGMISPMNGITPEQLKIRELLLRIEEGNVDEVIVATNPTVEGEATAMYLSKLLRPIGVRVTRLAYGVPVGADLEYADEITLFRALEGRREV